MKPLPCKLSERPMNNTSYGQALRAVASILESLVAAEQLELKYSPNGGGEHPALSRADWRIAVADDETVLGYWQWVEHHAKELLDASDDEGGPS